MQQCNGKNSYGKDQAKRVALAVMRRRNRRIRVYACDECYHWHITSEVGKQHQR